MEKSYIPRREMERIWLEYYNRFLFERGIITERERSRMAAMIRERQGSYE